MKNQIQLIADDGDLYVPRSAFHDAALLNHFSGNAILLVQNEDVQIVKWPNPDLELLTSALYAARETGILPNVSEVLLPDGKQFQF